MLRDLRAKVGAFFINVLLRKAAAAARQRSQF